MTSGARFGGYFGTESFASAFPSPEEIYVERVRRISDDGAFEEPVERTLGTVVRMDDCEIIELFTAEA